MTVSRAYSALSTFKSHMFLQKLNIWSQLSPTEADR